MKDTHTARRGAIVLMLLAAPAAARAQQEPGMPIPPLTLERLEQVALEHNPTLRQAQAQIDAARGRVRQAGAWPNPIVGTAERRCGSPGIRRAGNTASSQSRRFRSAASCALAATSHWRK